MRLLFNPLRIGDLAKAAGVTVQTIRYYERIGLLLPSARTPGNYRCYGHTEIRRLAFIRKCRVLGFAIDEIRELLAIADHGDRDCSAVDRLVSQHLAKIDHKITELRSIGRELRRLTGRCSGGSATDCRTPAALSRLAAP